MLNRNFAINFGKTTAYPTSPAQVLPPTRDGSPLEVPAIFTETYSNPTARGLWNKEKPEFTITPDEIRLSKAAERDQANQLPPWNSENIFLPFPQH
jgi:hypothetical protein